MHKQRIYIDTSVIGGCFDDEFAEWSNKLFDEFIEGKKIAVISDLTLEEIEDAPEKVQNKLWIIPENNFEIIRKNEENIALANDYIANMAISQKYFSDATHIAIATCQKVDVLVSWNFKHIVNLRRISLYNSVNLKYNYPIIEIRTPREVMDDDE